MEMVISNILLCTIITLMGYIIGLRVFKRFKKAWLNPLYSVSLFILCMLFLFHVGIERYSSGTGIFSLLLGTATVSLAVPLYKQLQIIQKYFFLIFWAVIPGTLAGVISVILLNKVLKLNQAMMYSLIPKSVTAPIAFNLSKSLGGIPSLTVMFVFISAVLSLLMGPLLFKFTRIKSSIAKGVALGTSAQAIGANRAFEWGELEGALGCIAMITSALFLSLITPILIKIYLL